MYVPGAYLWMMCRSVAFPPTSLAPRPHSEIHAHKDKKCHVSQARSTQHAHRHKKSHVTHRPNPLNTHTGIKNAVVSRTLLPQPGRTVHHPIPTPPPTLAGKTIESKIKRVAENVEHLRPRLMRGLSTRASLEKNYNSPEKRGGGGHHARPTFSMLTILADVIRNVIKDGVLPVFWRLPSLML